MKDHQRIVARFRKVAIAEGVSFLLLLGIAMPLKYLADMPMAVKIVGWAHGVLFMAYLVAAVPLFTKAKWELERIYPVFIAAILPFGTFWLEKRYLRSPGA